MRYYNDSISTTPESTAAALNAFPRKHILLIAGGYDKGLDLSPLAELEALLAEPVLVPGSSPATLTVLEWKSLSPV